MAYAPAEALKRETAYGGVRVAANCGRPRGAESGTEFAQLPKWTWKCIPPQSLHKETQPDFTQWDILQRTNKALSRTYFWPAELWANKWALFEVPKFMVASYAGIDTASSTAGLSRMHMFRLADSAKHFSKVLVPIYTPPLLKGSSLTWPTLHIVSCLGYSGSCLVMSHVGFNMHIPGDWGWAAFYLLIGHLLGCPICCWGSCSG